MNERRRLHLERLSLSRPNTGQGLQAKARAISFLLDAEVPMPVQKMIEELHWLIEAADETTGSQWESRRAEVQAQHLLKIFDNHVSRNEWPYEGDPDDVAPLTGYWPVYTEQDLAKAPFWDLDQVPGTCWYTYGDRDKLRRQLFGPPTVGPSARCSRSERGHLQRDASRCAGNRWVSAEVASKPRNGWARLMGLKSPLRAAGWLSVLGDAGGAGEGRPEAGWLRSVGATHPLG
jgi:hypothetical protein